MDKDKLNITVKTDDGWPIGIAWFILALGLCATLQDPGCVIKVNGTYYNISIGNQKETP